MFPLSQDFCFPSFFSNAVSLDTEGQCCSSWNKHRVDKCGKVLQLQLCNTPEKKQFFAVKMPQSLTSNVLHGDGAGSGQFPRHPEGFVTQLLVHQCTLGEEMHKDRKIQHPNKTKNIKKPVWAHDYLTDSPPSLAVFSSKWTEYKEKMATATRRIL